MAIVRWRPFGSTIDRWDPFRDLGDVQTEMNRVFDSFFGRAPQPALGERLWAPPVDVHETREDLVITAELPGVNEKDIHLSITGEVLTLRGERTLGQEVTQDSHYRLERWYGKFERTLPLPIPVQADKVKATYRDGVLRVMLPKAEEVKPREIKIDVI
jgi:HSP20 family protein